MGQLLDLPDALSATLRDLLAVLDLPEVDVGEALYALKKAVSFAAPSCLGLSMTLVVDGQAITLTAMDPDSDAIGIASSLRLPLCRLAPVAEGSELVLYAATPGAFVDLAADVSYALGLTPKDLHLDLNLTAPLNRSGIDGVVQHSMVNRAVGILIGRGHTPEAARRQLQHQATKRRMSLVQIAAHLISATE